MSLFISNKAFREAGLDPVKDAPKTWDDMKALGPKLKKVQGNRTVQKAFDYPYHSPRWEMQDVSSRSSSSSAASFSPTTARTATVNSPEGGQGADAVARSDQGYRRPEDDEEHLEQPEPRLHRWADRDVDDRAVGDFADPPVAGQGRLQPSFPGRRRIPPSRTPIVYGWAWGVNKAKPEAEKVAAWDFISFMLAKPDEWLAKAAFVQAGEGGE